MGRLRRSGGVRVEESRGGGKKRRSWSREEDRRPRQTVKRYYFEELKHQYCLDFLFSPTQLNVAVINNHCFLIICILNVHSALCDITKGTTFAPPTNTSRQRFNLQVSVVQGNYFSLAKYFFTICLCLVSGTNVFPPTASSIHCVPCRTVVHARHATHLADSEE